MLSWAEDTFIDIRLAMRTMARNPWYTLTALVAVALGVGASAAVFSAVDRVLFRPLPYRDEARLASVGMMTPLDTNEFLFAGGYLDLQRHPGPFEAVTAFQAGTAACDLTEQSPLRLDCLRLAANFLETLGVAPVAGRAFSQTEDLPNGPRVAMISYGLWQSRFAGDPHAIGRTLMLDGVPTAITGVLPADFLMPTLTRADVFLPLAVDESRERSGRALRAFGRLKPSVSAAQARAELGPYFERVLADVPARFRKEVSLRVRLVRDRQMGDARTASLALFGAVLAVMLIACANLANLLLARATGREREMAVRTALGASQARLARQVLTESLLLGLFGGAAGCGLAYALLRAFQSLGPDSLPRLGEATIDLRVLGFAVAAAILSGLAAGMAPAWRPGGTGFLSGSRATSRTRGWVRGTLVTAQIAVSMVLLAGAGLLLRSLWNLERVPLGLDSDRVVTASFVLGRQGYREQTRQLAFFDELERRVRALPGVEAAAITDSLPPSGGTRGRPFSTIEVEGRPRLPEGTAGMVSWRYVSPGYFSALGIPIRRGRGFTEADRGARDYSIILNETLARQMFPGEHPIGRRILRDPKGEWFTVIGVAADARNRGPARNVDAEYYVVRKAVADLTWANQEPPMGWSAASVVVRTAIDPRFATNEVRGLLQSMDGALPVEMGTMRGRVDNTTQRPRFYATLLGAFAGVGVVLAAIGLFGVMSFLVAQRRREIGVRMALGATRQAVMRQVLGFAARWAGCGLLAGMAAAAAATRWLQVLLFQVEPGDPRATAGAALLLAVVAIAAAAVPAWRAAAVDPAETLREE
jgi:predicted permease